MCDIARTSRSRNKPENVEIIEYRLEMHRKIDGNIAGVQGVSRIRVQSVCGLINGFIVSWKKSGKNVRKGLWNMTEGRLTFIDSVNVSSTRLPSRLWLESAQTCLLGIE